MSDVCRVVRVVPSGECLRSKVRMPLQRICDSVTLISAFFNNNNNNDNNTLKKNRMHSTRIKV